MLKMWNFVRRCREPERLENQRHARSVNWFAEVCSPTQAPKKRYKLACKLVNTPPRVQLGR
jgi:hypothetical protein